MSGASGITSGSGWEEPIYQFQLGYLDSSSGLPTIQIVGSCFGFVAVYPCMKISHNLFSTTMYIYMITKL